MFTIDELKQDILNAFKEIYKVEYVSTIQIKKLEPKGYSVRLGIPNDYKPLYITLEVSDEKFPKLFRKELRDRQMQLVDFFEGQRVIGDECMEEFDTRCGCHKRN